MIDYPLHHTPRAMKLQSNIILSDSQLSLIADPKFALRIYPQKTGCFPCSWRLYFLTVIFIASKEYFLVYKRCNKCVDYYAIGMITLTTDKYFMSTRVILDSLPFPIAVVDRRSKIIRVNKSWMEPVWRTGIFGDISIEPGGNYLETCRRAATTGILLANDVLNGIQGVCDGSMPFYELDYPCHSPGGERLFFLTVNPLLSPEAGAIITHSDISKRLAMVETFKGLSGWLINAREEERTRIARELHDNLSQKMALLSIEIEQLAQLPPQSTTAVSAGLAKALGSAQDISSDIFRLSYASHPYKLDRLGLAAAALSLCKEFSRLQGLQVDCDFKNIPADLPHDIALCLYRVIQESLQNIAKHSGACNAVLELCGSPCEIRLCVEDEGVGFEPESASRKRGMGLLSMGERLRLVGGTISIESQPLRGTRITARIPLNAADAESASDSKMSKSLPH
jgi:signal transduction histidine kinase